MNRHNALFRFIPAILSACALLGCYEHDADIEVTCDSSGDYAYIIQTEHKKFVTIVQCSNNAVRPVIKRLDISENPLDGLVICAKHCENGKDAHYLYKINAIENPSDDDPKYSVGSMKIDETTYAVCAEDSPSFEEFKCLQS